MGIDAKGRRRTFGRLIAIAIVCLFAGAGAIWLLHRHGEQEERQAGSGMSKELPVPVTLGKAQRKDVPIYLDGLGTVQAFNYVTVRSRVDGQIVKVLFTEGQDVKAGDLLFQIDPAPYQAALDQSAAKKDQDEAQLSNMRLDMERYVKLIASGSVSAQTHDTQKSLVAQYEAAVKADQAAIDSSKVNLDYAKIRSPIDGRVGIRQVDIGNIVHASDSNGLVIVTQLKPIAVIFTLPETSLRLIQREQGDVAFPVLALARDNHTVIATGKLAVIDNQIDSTTGTIKLKAVFSNENLHLWPGLFVNARLLLETRKDGIVVPSSAVQRGPEGTFAFAVQEGQSVKMQPLKVAQMENGEALIDEGLKDGDIVVVDGQYKLRDGAHVKAIETEAASSKDAAPQKRKQRNPQ